MLAFQCAHVAGDGYSNSQLRLAFAEAFNALSAGRAATPISRPATRDVAIEEIEAALPMDVRALEDIVRRPGRLRPLRLRAKGANAGGEYELRVFQAVAEGAQYAPVIAHARRLGIAPLALLGAALASAARETAAAWAEQPGDFFGVSVPRDFRGVLGRTGQIGNFSYPQGIPVFADDPSAQALLAKLFFDRLERGGGNRIMYRHFFTSLRQAANARVPEKADSAPRLPFSDGELVLSPFAAFGVTEIPNWGEVQVLGTARVLSSVFQTPLLTRRFADGRVHLSLTVRWHAAFDRSLRSFFATLLQYVFGAAPVNWNLS